jgi:hypothetical protein
MNIETKSAVETGPTSEPIRETYNVPTILAENTLDDCFAAGCPSRDSYMCNSCFRR